MVTLDEKMVASLREDYASAPISEQDRAMLDYVVQLTKDATRLTPQDHDKLRAVGFDDTAILQTFHNRFYLSGLRIFGMNM